MPTKSQMLEILTNKYDAACIVIIITIIIIVVGVYECDFTLEDVFCGINGFSYENIDISGCIAPRATMESAGLRKIIKFIALLYRRSYLWPIISSINRKRIGKFYLYLFFRHCKSINFIYSTFQILIITNLENLQAKKLQKNFDLEALKPKKNP